LRVDWRISYPSIGQPILVANCAATSQALARRAGLAIPVSPGNAVDAVTATAVALTVVEPVTNSIGSDAFAIVALGGALEGLVASGRSRRRGRAGSVFRTPGVPIEAGR
jgi:gamma-glutamyltranspeptidase/glutathione hydrolase